VTDELADEIDGLPLSRAPDTKTVMQVTSIKLAAPTPN
jgi:hypothetical protein